MASSFRKLMKETFKVVGERELEKRYTVRAARGPVPVVLDSNLVTLYRQGYMARQIASLLKMELSEVNRQLRTLPPVKVLGR